MATPKDDGREKGAMVLAKREPHYKKKNNHISKVDYHFDFTLLITNFTYLI
jgi:hypothetical protein